MKNIGSHVKYIGNHFIRKCSECGTVICQCRCPSKDKTVEYAVCDECKAKEGKQKGNNEATKYYLDSDDEQ